MTKKKKKSLLTRLFEFQSKPLRILAKEITKGVKEGKDDKKQD